MAGQYRISGAIFKNESGRGPEMSGFIEIEGKKENISLWPKRSAKGQDYWQVSENKMQDKNQPSPAPAMNSPMKPRRAPDPGPAVGGRFSDMDDDVPFAPEFR